MAKSDKTWPKQFARVTIIYREGDVDEFIISAGVSLTKHLAHEAGETGVLILIDFETKVSQNIPLQAIRRYTVQELTAEEIESLYEKETAE